MAQKIFQELKAGDWWLKQLDSIKSEKDLVYIGRANLITLYNSYVSAAEEDQSLCYALCQVSRISMPQDLQASILREDLGRSGYLWIVEKRTSFEVDWENLELIATAEEISDKITQLSREIATAKKRAEYLYALYKRAKPKPIFAHWRNGSYCSTGDQCVSLKSNYNKDAPINERFEKIEITNDRNHYIIMNARLCESGEFCALLIKNAYAMLTTDFEYLKTHDKYRQIWLEFEGKFGEINWKNKLEEFEASFK